MPRLFVDCDDTLVKYQDRGDPTPYGVKYGVPWLPNERLINGVIAYRHAHPEALIVVWSGGGQEYAQMWADKLLSSIDVTAMVKDETTFGLVLHDSIVVDDQDLGIPTGGRQFKPDEWPEEN